MKLTDEQIKSLAEFVLEILDEFPDMGALDGGDLQEIGEKHKILIPHMVHNPCGEDCYCGQFYNDEEWQSGVTCYRIVDWLVRDAELRNEAVGAVAEESPKNLRTEDSDAGAMGETG